MSNVTNPNAAMRSQSGQLPGGITYVAFLKGYAGYATPTDFIGLRGVAGKAISVRFFGMLCQATAATLAQFYFYRRAALNTNGTPTAITAAKYVSTDPNAGAVFNEYTTAPTINDGAAPLLSYANSSIAALTASPTQVNLGTSGLSVIVNLNIDVGKPLVILENQELVMNFNGVALPAGFLGCPYAQWTETPL